MTWESATILLAGYAAAFFLVPHQIMLATANRIGRPFHSFNCKFRRIAPERLALTVAGATTSFILASVGGPLWTSVQFGLTLSPLYMLDLHQVERLSRNL